MKKILLTLLLGLFMIPGVSADTEIAVVYKDIVIIPSHLVDNNYQYLYQDFDTFISNEDNKAIFNNLYKELLKIYNSNYSEIYPYYLVSVGISSTSSSTFEFDKLGITMNLYNDIPEEYDNENYTLYATYQNSYYYYGNSDDTLNFPYWHFYFSPIVSVPVYNVASYAPTFFFTSNFEVPNDFIPNYSVSVTDKSGNTFYLSDTIPVMNAYSVTNDYTEVNLDDYEYVILNLKNYSKTEAFETNLQVKGSVGITPLYNYGQAEKSVVTDRCNLSYSDFTDYRFFILKNDLTNNAFYIVKACEENSSFRFDSTLFDITYVTTENVDDPVVTFGGIEYHTIPFNKLSNSANQNEQNNFIPGESGSSLTDIINNISDFTSDIWNAVSSFMGLVTKFFNTLPEEFRYLSITSFTVLTVIAIIKFIRG